MTVPYSSTDPLIQALLNAISGGESGGPVSGNNLFLGYGGANLTGSQTNSFGFPIWAGVQTAYGPTHAAGIFQFEPGTFNNIAAQYGLNFNSVSGQSAAAWYNAQQADPGLYQQLQSGNIGAIQSALTGQWPSVNSSAFASRLSAGLSGGGASSSGNPSSTALSGSVERSRLAAALSHLLSAQGHLALFNKSKRGGASKSKASKTSGSPSASPLLVSPSLSSASSPSSGPRTGTTARSAFPSPQSEKGSQPMSTVSKYIESHTTWLNAFLPALKGIVDELPVPAAVKAGFDTAYGLAPEVILSGAALLSELQGGTQQPAALALATAFNGGPAPAPAPAAPVAPVAPTLVPAATPPAPAPAAPVFTGTPAPASQQLLVPAVTPPASTPPATVNVGGQAYDAGQIAQLAAALGLTVMDQNTPVPPGP